jgi:gamma-glutamylcyclotransferase (GGCT)/AIG2-like uncharacterized protein YtfP
MRLRIATIVYMRPLDCRRARWESGYRSGAGKVRPDGKLKQLPDLIEAEKGDIRIFISNQRPQMDNVTAGHIFVYGTLMRRFQNAAAIRLRRNASFIGTATLSGKLFNLGAYPGVLLSQDAGSVVHGEVFRLSGNGQLLRFLDQYESCAQDDPQPHFYRREITLARLASGGHLPVWVYALINAPAGLYAIPTGRFSGAARRRLRKPLLEAPPMFG